MVVLKPPILTVSRRLCYDNVDEFKKKISKTPAYLNYTKNTTVCSDTYFVSCAFVFFLIQLSKSSTIVRNASVSYVAEWSPIAYKKPTVQGPKATDGGDSKAVDGILRTRREDCTVVGPAKDPWWSVDLGMVYDVNGVSITTSENQSGSAVT